MTTEKANETSARVCIMRIYVGGKYDIIQL